MSQFQVEASAEIDAPPQAAYAVLADYRVGHPALLPRGHTVVVESGGTGAGTVFTLNSKVMGVTRSMRMAVTEPEPGRVLVESDTAPGGAVTTFTVEPLRGGGASLVTISNVSPIRPGVMGHLEALATRAYLRRMMNHELRALAALASRAGAAEGRP